MKSIKNILIVVAVLISIYFIYDLITREDKVVYIPIKIDVPVPAVKGSSDTIYEPVPIYVDNPIDKKLIKENEELLKKYREADSIIKENKYKDAISIREYKEVFEDTFQTVEVYSKTRGELLEQSISYETKPYTIPLDTVVKTTVRGRFKVMGQVELGTPILNEVNFDKVIVKPSIIFKNSKDNGLSVSIDTQGTGWIGVLYTF